MHTKREKITQGEREREREREGNVERCSHTQVPTSELFFFSLAAHQELGQAVDPAKQGGTGNADTRREENQNEWLQAECPKCTWHFGH